MSQSNSDARPTHLGDIRDIAPSLMPLSRRSIMQGTSLAAIAAVAPRIAAATGNVSQSSRGASFQDDPAGTLHLPFYPFGQPVVLDPHRAPNWGPFWVLYPYLWTGLLGFDENGSVVLNLAASFEPNEKADVWTAVIRPDLVFPSGTPITSQSFVDSWLRAIDPYQPAPMNTFMGLVEGFGAYLRGESNDIGFAIVDDQTLEITLSEPFSSFPSYVATFGWAVLDIAAMDAATHPLLAAPGFGPWKVESVADDQSPTFIPQSGFEADISSTVQRIVWHVYDGPAAFESALADFASGGLAIADVPASLHGAVTGDATLADKLVEIPLQASTLAIGMDFNQPPFDDLRYRQAVAAAINRDEWVSSQETPSFVPAIGMVPPVVAETSGYTSAALPAFSADEARSLLEAAGYDPEGDGPEIVYYQSATNSVEDLVQGASLLSMIETNSGLVIRHDTTLTTEQIAALQQDNGGRQFDLTWWWTDSSTASMLERIGASHSPAMAGWFNWSPELVGIDDQNPGEASTAFDEAIVAANGTTDEASRNEAFQSAEQLLLDNAVYVPLGHWVQRFVQQPWLRGTKQGPWSGSIPLAIDADVTLATPEDGS